MPYVPYTHPLHALCTPLMLVLVLELELELSLELLGPRGDGLMFRNGKVVVARCGGWWGGWGKVWWCGWGLAVVY